MNLRWLWLDHFPPGMELTEAQKAEAKKRARDHRREEPAYRGSFRRAVWIAGVWAGVLSLAFALWMVMLIGWKLRTGQYVIVHLSGILVFQGLLWMGIALALQRSRAPYIRKALCDMGLPVCVECGYNLTGIGEHQPCPECGAARELQPASDHRS
jgi:hypothetical protein